MCNYEYEYNNYICTLYSVHILSYPLIAGRVHGDSRQHNTCRFAPFIGAKNGREALANRRSLDRKIGLHHTAYSIVTYYGGLPP